MFNIKIHDDWKIHIKSQPRNKKEPLKLALTVKKLHKKTPPTLVRSKNEFHTLARLLPYDVRQFYLQTSSLLVVSWINIVLSAFHDWNVFWNVFLRLQTPKNRACCRYHRFPAKKRFKNTVRGQKGIVPSRKTSLYARRVAKQPSRRAKTATDVQKRAYRLFSTQRGSFLPRFDAFYVTDAATGRALQRYCIAAPLFYLVCLRARSRRAGTPTAP